MTKLRRDAYEIVDERSGGQCEGLWRVDGYDTAVRCPFKAVEHHHRRARRAGGSTDPATETAANILHVCRLVHHRWAESEREDAYEAGWLLHDGADPASVPVLTWQGLVLLREDGATTPVEAT